MLLRYIHLITTIPYGTNYTATIINAKIHCCNTIDKYYIIKLIIQNKRAY